jgi:hypothetical protein
MGLRNHELLAICEALRLTPPPRATVADLEMMLKHWYNSRGNSQLVPYTGAVAVAPAWVMAHRAAAITPVAAGRQAVGTGGSAAAAAAGPDPSAVPVAFKEPVKLDLTWKNLANQNKGLSCMDNDTVLSQLMTLWEHDFVKFDAPEEVRVISSGRQLDIFKTFSENNVQNEQVLWLMKRIVGGMGGLKKMRKSAGGRNIIVDPKARAFAPNDEAAAPQEAERQGPAG